MTGSKKLADQLRDVLARELPNLRAVSDAEAATRPGGGPGWTRKQELGHLLDSATNNRIRFVVATLEGSFIGSGYNQGGWVDLGGYGEMSWTDLIELWLRMNQHIGGTIARIPESRLNAQCNIGAGAPVTLGLLIEDYVLHMQHHLDHILARAAITEYPGAKLGV